MRKLFLWALTLILLAGLGYGLLRPSGETAKPPVNTPPAAQAEPGTETKKGQAASNETGSRGPARGQMSLSPEARQAYEVRENDATYAETMRNDKKGIQIAPGVIFESGKGVSVKTAKQAETIEIKRDNTYRDSEYKVQWEKKF